MEHPAPAKKRSAKAGLILKSAEDLFRKHGFRRVSAEEICRAASVSKMTFYKYFPNKIELFKEIMTGWYDDSVKELIVLKGTDVPFQEIVMKILRLKREFLSELSNEFLTDYLDPVPELEEFMKQFYAKGIQLFVDFIRDAQVRGEARKEVRPEFLIAVLDKMGELAQDKTLAALYPSVMDFSMEINNFFYCGILPLEKSRNESA
jgi:AcrR family transcriptional regulator